MHATQPQGGACPEPRTQIGAPENQLAALLTDPNRFRLCIARQVSAAVAASAAQQVMPDQTDADSHVVTDTGLHAPTVSESTADHATATAAQVLHNAAAYLQRYGWIQGAYYDTTARRFTPAACMVGAIGMVCYGGPVEAPAQHFDDPGYLDFEEAVLHLDRWLLVEDGSEAYEFNDAKGRRVEDVIDVLRHAAATTADELVGALRVLNGHDAHRVSEVGADVSDSSADALDRLFGGDVE